MLPGHKAPTLPLHTPSIHPSTPALLFQLLCSHTSFGAGTPLLCPSQVLKQQAEIQAALLQAGCSLLCQTLGAGTCAPSCPTAGLAAVMLPALPGSKGETKTSGAAPVSVEGE